MGIDPKKVQEIFLSAAELEEGEGRCAYLAEACGMDSALRERVEALLASHKQADSLLDIPLVSPPKGGTGNILGKDPERDTADTRLLGADGEWGEEDALHFLSPSQRPDSLGRIGHYEVIQVLGRGGFGIVFKALDDILQRVVAIKMMAPQLAVTSPARKRFLREARTSAQVRHESVVQVYEVAEQPLPYLAMEYIPGETLQQRLDRIGPIEPAEAVRIGRQIAEGLAAAHATDLIHRDIKPGNILLENGTQKVKLTDFGLARAADDASISQSGIIAGTPMYMAPEQALGNKLDQRADLFSLGSVLYQMVAGRPPFRASSTLAVLKRVTEDTPRDIREIIPETPGWLCDIIGKLHAKDPLARFQSAREVAELLGDCESQLRTDGKLKDLSRIPPSQARAKTSALRAVVAIGIPAVIFLAATTVVFLMTQDNPVAGGGAPAVVDPLVNRQETPDGKVEQIKQLSAAEQIQETRRELILRNPDFDGKLEPTITEGVVTGLKMSPVGLKDISPLRMLEGLTNLDCRGEGSKPGQLSDLALLKGLKLSTLEIDWNEVSDLSPLAGMPLATLSISATQVRDLSALKGMHLRTLNADNCAIGDLSPLMGMPLEVLNCSFTGIESLAPLKGAQLRILWSNNTGISDLSPLRGMPLEWLTIQNTKVKDLTPLRGMPLSNLYLDIEDLQDPGILRSFQSLARINDKPAAEFLK